MGATSPFKMAGPLNLAKQAWLNSFTMGLSSIRCSPCLKSRASVSPITWIFRISKCSWTRFLSPKADTDPSSRRVKDTAKFSGSRFLRLKPSEKRPFKEASLQADGSSYFKLITNQSIDINLTNKLQSATAFLQKGNYVP